MLYVRRKPFVQSQIPHLDTWRGGKALSHIPLTSAMLELSSQKLPPELDSDKEYDLVYIVKESETNDDLKFSLRSVAKFCTYRNIWIVGYKPSWVKNVNYIPTEQTGNKWTNSVLNYTAACQNPEISDNFVLMNDDFFAIRPIRDWKAETNKCLGTFSEKLEGLKGKKQLSRWQNAFVYGAELFKQLGCKTEYNYEAHLPIIINKGKFLKMLDKPQIRAFMETSKVLHKRSVYNNLYQDPNIIPIKIKDVKLELQEDLSDERLNSNWLSVYDYMVNNLRVYPKLNKTLNLLYNGKCKYEV